MYRHFWKFLGFVPVSTAYCFSQYTTADVCEQTLPSVFRILLVDPRSGALIGIGSGFFIKPDGTALTAFHVLQPQSNLIAKLDSGEQFPVKLVNGHQLTDIAVVKVEVPHKVPFVNLGNSDDARRGEQVVHVGNTMYSDTNDIEIGYINKLRDDCPAWLREHIKGDLAPPTSGLTFIKTTGSVRPGFSGGPLVNMNGDVIGLISRVFVSMHQTGLQQEGACIPINLVKSILKQLEIRGSVERPFVGLSFTRTDGGLGIVKVQPGSPAERAGLKVGDIIIESNGNSIQQPEDFYKILGYTIGIKLRVKVLRGSSVIMTEIVT